jgi:conserved repeat domain
VDAAILKTVTPPTATLGDVITYVVVVPATPITATLYNVTVTDQLDARLQLHAVADGPDGTVVTAGNAFTVTYASIPAGQQRFITVTAVLSSPLGADAGDVITNLAVLRHQDGGPTPSNRPAFTVTEPSLTLVKASEPPTSNTVVAGQAVTYTVRITNATGITVSPAYDLVFTDTLPEGMRDVTPTLVTVTLNGAPVAPTDYITGYNLASGVFTVAFTSTFSVPVGGELVIQYRATVDSDVPAAVDLTNRAEATYSSLPGPVPGDRDYGPISDTTTVHTPLATGLSKSVAPPTVTIGSQVVFSITLPDPPVGAVLHNVVFTDVVDSRLRIDAVHCPTRFRPVLQRPGGDRDLHHHPHLHAGDDLYHCHGAGPDHSDGGHADH